MCDFNILFHVNREEVRNHSVSWQSEYEFSCKISANEDTGILENCCCRVSIRKVKLTSERA